MDDEDKYAFCVMEGTVNSYNDGTTGVSVGDVKVNNVLIDSGNIIDKELQYRSS